MNTVLTLTYNQLSTFAGSDNFWNLFDTTFGTQYNRSAAEILRLQWLSGDFSQLPQVEILDSNILGGANGAYATSTNKIYLSANFIATSTAEAISAVLLEEIGHFIDAQINQIDTPGDEGEKFSALVRGQNLTTQELDRINTENDSANITVGGEQVAVEQNTPVVLTVTTTADQNDGSATGGLSLRDAIIIANANPTTDYEIQLTGGTTYNLTSNGINENAALTGDLDIKSRSNVLYIVAVGGQATINASGLLNSDRVFQVLDGGQLSLQNVMVTGGNISSDGGGIRVDSNAALDLYNSTVTGNKASGFSNSGGGIYNSGFVYLRNGSIVSNNIAAGDSSQEGGGIYNSGGTLIATNSTISNNEGGVYGGGISTVSGSVTLINTTVRGNSAGNGGGIDSNGTSVTLLNTTISGNSARNGGGIYASTNGVFNLINSTVTKNTAISTEYGDGGGGIYSLSATVNLKNTIVAGNINSNAPDLLSSFLSSALFNGNNNNLIGSLAGAKGTVGTGTDIVNPNPGLGPLQNNGGLTLTHALLSGSPAINAGNNSLIPADTEDLDGDGNRTEPIPFDNRGSGYTRISGGTVDIGAFEFQPAPNLNLSINDVTLTEGNSGTKNAIFTVTLSGETFQPVTVNYATANGTATAGSDYTATTGTLIFNVNPGETSKQITVPILGDTLAESDETFFINLSNPINATIADNQGITTITNDDGSIGNTLPEVEGNNTFATAQVIANTSFNRQLVADIQDFNGSNISTTYDHVSILGTGDGTFDLYRFNALANTQLVFDIDNNNFDTILRLWNPNNNQLLSSNDDGIETGNTGNSTASFLTYKTLTTSDYVIGVYRYSSSALTPPATGDSYTLHLSMLNDDVFTPIESAGNTKLVKDATNKYFTQVGTNTPIAIKNGGQQIYQDIYGSGWQTIAAETVNGDNQVLWKNVSGNYLHIWSLDNNWNWVSSEGNWGLNSADAFTQETNFGIDANGDGVIGNPYTAIESAGNTKLVKDAANKYFTQVGTNTPIAIKNGGQQIYQDIYGSGWQTIAAETVNGDNQVLWKNVSGNYLHIWHLDNNWNWVSSEGNWGLNSAEALTQETNFSIDANGDGVIGNPYTAIESAGNTKLVKDATNKYFTQIGTNTPTAIKNGGQQIYENIYAGWQTIAAETVNGDNQVLWKNISGNYLHIWHLDNNWNWVSSQGNWGLNSAEALTQETNFAIDANGDGVIGYTPIELAGNTKLVKDATNKYFTQIGTNTPTAIKNGGQQIYQNIYAGWQTIAAETVNGVNQVLWKNISGNYLHIWSLDSNWNWVSSQGNWGLNSADAFTQETNFGIDANGDGSIGNPSSLTLTGTSANDFLVGGANNDILTGGGGKDTLTGGLGSDKFVYQNLTDSLLSNFDVITDFNATTGNDLFRVSTARAGFVDVGAVNTLDAAGIGAKLTATAFGSNYAAQFSFGQKTFVAINDATAGFNAANDAIIEVTGLTGTLNVNHFVIV